MPTAPLLPLTNAPLRKLVRCCVALAVMLVVPAAWAADSAVQPSRGVQDVSLIRLIATPDAFDGKVVQVVAFLHLEFEGDALYLTRDDLKNGIMKNAVWIDIPDEVRRRASKFSDRYVLVGGTFSSQNKGHMSLFGGALTEIGFVEVWNPRGRPERWNRPRNKDGR